MFTVPLRCGLYKHGLSLRSWGDANCGCAVGPTCIFPPSL